MRYFDHFSMRMTYPQLPDHPPRFAAEVPSFAISSVWGGHVVVPRVCQLQDPACITSPGKCNLHRRPKIPLGFGLWSPGCTKPTPCKSV